MDIDKRIEKLKQRNEFCYDEDIILCIKTMETLQEVKKIIDIDNSLIQEDVIKYKMICELVEKVFGKDSESK